MRTSYFRIASAILALLSVGRLFAQTPEQPVYLNTSLSPEERATDLVHRMTIEEKAPHPQQDAQNYRERAAGAY